LAENVIDQEYQARFVILQANVLLAMEHRVNSVELSEALLNSFRLLRKLSDYKNWILLAPLPATAVCTTDFAKIVQSSFRNTDFRLIADIFLKSANASDRIKRAVAPSGQECIDENRHYDDEHGDQSENCICELPGAALPNKEAAKDVHQGDQSEQLGPDIDKEPVLLKQKKQRNIREKPDHDEEEDASEKYIRDIQPGSALQGEEAAEYILHGGRPEELATSNNYEPVPPRVLPPMKPEPTWHRKLDPLDRCDR
jgi:hypothetical protein